MSWCLLSLKLTPIGIIAIGGRPRWSDFLRLSRRGFRGSRLYSERAIGAPPFRHRFGGGFRHGPAFHGGFRRGPHVVYYGEFYPDMDTVFGKMGQTEVNGRWGKAFEGIITTITEADGSLIVAKEMYHND